MSREEFIIFIKSIGFTTSHRIQEYKEYRIDLYKYEYGFYNGSEWIYYIKLDDLTPLEKYFKRELRSIKLKKIL